MRIRKLRVDGFENRSFNGLPGLNLKKKKIIIIIKFKLQTAAQLLKLTRIQLSGNNSDELTTGNQSRNSIEPSWLNLSIASLSLFCPAAD